MPSWGFSLAVSGSTIPLFVFSSFSTGLTTTRSANRLRFMCALPRGLRFLVGDHAPRVGQVHAPPVGVLAEDLSPQAGAREARRHQVVLDALAPEAHGPALDCHTYQPSEGSIAIAGGTPPPAGFAGDLPGERGDSGEVKNPAAAIMAALSVHRDRKSTRLNSSHQIISYAV